MSSIGVLYAEGHNSLPETDTSNEYSMLPEVSCHTTSQNIVVSHVNGNFDLTNMQSCLSSASEISVSDIESSFKEILKENKSLKNDLHNNHVLMREQMKAILDWRERIVQSKNEQRQMLEQAKINLTAMQEENAALREQLSAIENECQKLRTQVCKNCEGVKAAMQSLQEENQSVERVKTLLVGELRNKAQLQEQVGEHLVAMQLYLDNLLSDKKISKSEREELSAIVQSLTVHINVLKDSRGAQVLAEEESGFLVVDEDQSVARHFGPLRNSNVIEDLEKRTQERDLLLVQVQEMSDVINSLRQKVQNMEELVESSNEKMNSWADADKYRVRCESLQQQLIAQKEQLEVVNESNDSTVVKLRNEADDLCEMYKLEKLSHQKDNEKLTELMQEFEKLRMEYDQLKQQYKKDEKRMMPEQSVKDESQARSLLEEVDHLTAHLLDSQDKLEEKNEEIQKLEEKVSTLIKENEIIPLLRSQIDLYKEDLEQTLIARDSAYADLEKLEKEVKGYRKKGPESSSRRSSTSKKDPNVKCPICDNYFKDNNALQEHIERCLENQ